MKLETALRQDFAIKIRPFYIKESCEICNTTEELHLHHVEQFAKVLSYVLELLELPLLDTDDYTNTQFKLIKKVMLGLQLGTEYITCCQECHLKLHDGAYNTFSLRKKDKSISQEDIAKIEEYLNSLVGKYHYGQDIKNELADVVGLVDKRNNRLIKNIATINAHIISVTNGKYSIVSATDKRRKLDNGEINTNRDKNYISILTA